MNDKLFAHFTYLFLFVSDNIKGWVWKVVKTRLDTVRETETW